MTMKPNLIIFPLIAVSVMIFVSGCAMPQHEAISGVVGFRKD
jgi:hypothetical protein